MDLEQTNALIGLGIGAATLLGIVIGWMKWVRPRIRKGVDQVTGVRDAILGREAIVDSITGKELAPALPGMGVRMAQQEAVSKLQQEQMTLLTDAVAKLANTHQRLDDHDRRLNALEAAAIERVATKAESVAAWRAVAAVAGDKDVDEPTEASVEPPSIED